eukprot:COSAG02_NODE_5503_length_4277_cov_2.008617_3_plen_301_part_00
MSCPCAAAGRVRACASVFARLMTDSACGVLCCLDADSSLVSVPSGGEARDAEDELIDISMDSPDGGADSAWYKCASVAAFNTTLEFDATTPISGKVRPGVVVEALEHADTRAGRRRFRSQKGWFSLVSTNGTRCDKSQATSLGGEGAPRPGEATTLASFLLPHAAAARLRAGCSSRAADRKRRERRGPLTSGQAPRVCLALAAPAQRLVGQGGAGRQRSSRVPQSRTQPGTSSGLRASDSPAAVRIPTRQLCPAVQRGRHSKRLFVICLVHLPTMHAHPLTEQCNAWQLIHCRCPAQRAP